jgi:hypothetical protein
MKVLLLIEWALQYIAKIKMDSSFASVFDLFSGFGIGYLVLAIAPSIMLSERERHRENRTVSSGRRVGQE